MAAMSERVVRARALDVRTEQPAGTGVVLTVTRFAVLEDFTGHADPIIEVRELGGTFGDRTMWVPGAPRFVRGQEVVLCLEAWRGGYRTVSMGFSAFVVQRPGAGQTALQRMEGGIALVGAAGFSSSTRPRTVEEFRDIVSAVKGVRAVTPVQTAPAVPDAAASSTPVADAYTLFDLRWHQADTDTPVVWYRNPDSPSPLTSGNTDGEIQTALSAWTNPSTARISLMFGGFRSHPGASIDGGQCDAANLGVGIITFDDPGDYLTGNTLAIGGGCGGSPDKTVNGHTFSGFTHGFVVFNQLSGSFTAAPNFTRVLAHEIGHGIGLGHSTSRDALMYPSCCDSLLTPTPPAIGADDLAGIEFIYPMPAGPPPPCTFSITPTSASYPFAGGSSSVSVAASASTCAWTAGGNTSWLTVTSGASRTGSGSVGYSVAGNAGAARSGTLTVAGETFTVAQDADPSLDSDLDTLPDWWETAFGLNPSSPAGNDGPGGDPDGDGRTNLQEFNAGTHPRGFATRYLAEGAVNAFFQTEIELLNPGATQALTLLRIQPQDGVEKNTYFTVPPLTRHTVTSAELGALAGGSFSTVIESDQPLVVDRTMTWDATGYGAHAETSVAAPSTTWYLAEGSTSGDFSLFYLLQNPGTVESTATVRFLRPAPQAPFVRTYTLPPNSRTTIPVDEIPELVSTDVSGVVQATSPIIVERSMYLSRPGQPFVAGHESAGVTAPSNTWFLAEGATGSFFELFVLIENPNTGSSAVEVDYLLPNGTTLTKAYAVAGNSRFTIYVDEEQFPAGSGNKALANASMSMRVRTTNNVPIIVERSMWWPQPAWYEAHNSPGTTVTGTKWALAGGELGGATGWQTYVLVANTSSFAGTANVTLFFEDATPPLSAQVNLAPNSRTNVDIASMFPTAANRRFGTIVQSTGTPTPPQIVVERSMYSSAGGLLWSAGTAAVATRLAP